MINPKGTTTQYQYDNLNRRTETDYGVVSGTPTSTVKLTYDLADRLLQVLDSAAGTTPTTRQYGTTNTSLASGLNFMTEEVTPQGTVSYTPDSAGRRTSMIVTGYPQVSYGYDNANKLTGVTQGSWNVTKSFNYSAGRLGSVTLPNGVVVSYTYDNDSQVKSLTYKKSSGTTLGTLSYNYDADGQRIGISGTLATTGIPAAQTFTYNNDDSLASVGGFTVSTDNNGDITGMNGGCPTCNATFTWDERNRLQQSLSLVNGEWVTQSDSYDAFSGRYGIVQTIGRTKNRSASCTKGSI